MAGKLTDIHNRVAKAMDQTACHFAERRSRKFRFLQSDGNSITANILEL
jgi:hypothetical protein